MKNTECPRIDICKIRQATDNFSDNYKLGQGGFGIVYKVKIHRSDNPNFIYKIWFTSSNIFDIPGNFI